MLNRTKPEREAETDNERRYLALSDGAIVLSKKALSIVRESVKETEVQARLAFVLGHELAHLAGNDFWDNQISQALLASSA